MITHRGKATRPVKHFSFFITGLILFSGVFQAGLLQGRVALKSS